MKFIVVDKIWLNWIKFIHVTGIGKRPDKNVVTLNLFSMICEHLEFQSLSKTWLYLLYWWIILTKLALIHHCDRKKKWQGFDDLDLIELLPFVILCPVMLHIKFDQDWALAFEFHSSNAHAQPSSGARCLSFGRTLRLLPYFMCANSEGSGETAQMRKLAWAFAGRLCYKYHNLMNWLILSCQVGHA